MPIYPYECDCGHKFDVYAKMSELENLSPNCPNCGILLGRLHRRLALVNFSGEKVEDPQWCPALGCVVKNQKDRERIAKARGYEAVGNESIDTVNSFFDQKQKEQDKKHSEDLKDTVMSALQ